MITRLIGLSMNSYGRLASSVIVLGLLLGSSVAQGQPLIAEIGLVNPEQFVVGEALQFEDASLGNPNVWCWNFEGLTEDDEGPCASRARNPPPVTYSSTGRYKIRLEIQREEGVAAVFDDAEREVLICDFDVFPKEATLGPEADGFTMTIVAPEDCEWTLETQEGSNGLSFFFRGVGSRSISADFVEIPPPDPCTPILEAILRVGNEKKGVEARIRRSHVLLSDAGLGRTAIEQCQVRRDEGKASFASCVGRSNCCQNKSGQLTIAYWTLPALTSDKRTPILFLGADGEQPATSLAEGPAYELLTALQTTRDVVIVDMRGTGRSCAVQCSSPSTDLQLQGQGPHLRNSYAEAYRRNSAKCARRREVRQVDRLENFNVREMALDLEPIVEEVLSRNPQASGVAVWAAGENSLVALEASRLLSNSVSGLILQSARSSKDVVVLPRQIHRAFRRVARVLERSHPEVGDLVVRLRSLMERLAREPLRPAEAAIQIGAADFLGALIMELGSRDGLERVPRLVEQAALGPEGDNSDLVRLVRRNRESALGNAVSYSAYCTIPVGSRRAKQFDAQVENRKFPLADGAGFPSTEICEAWGLERSIENPSQRPPRSLPVLLITADMDTRVPREVSRELVAKSEMAFEVKVRRATHQDLYLAQIAPHVEAFLSGRLEGDVEVVLPRLQVERPN